MRSKCVQKPFETVRNDVKKYVKSWFFSRPPQTVHNISFTGVEKIFGNLLRFSNLVRPRIGTDSIGKQKKPGLLCCLSGRKPFQNHLTRVLIML